MVPRSDRSIHVIVYRSRMDENCRARTGSENPLTSRSAPLVRMTSVVAPLDVPRDDYEALVHHTREEELDGQMSEGTKGE